MPLHQEERAKLADFVVSHNDGEFFKSSLMPVVFKKNFNQFVQFAAGLVSNFEFGVADGCQRRSITGSSSASSTYPIPESPEHQKQLGDMRVICKEPVWK